MSVLVFLSQVASKMQDADNAFGIKQALKVKKQKKSQGSSRYRPIGAQELTTLPLLKGSTELYVICVFNTDVSCGEIPYHQLAV